MTKHIYEIRGATIEDAHELAPKVRQADLDEIEAASDSEPLEALVKSLTSSNSPKTGLIDGEVVCMFGVATNNLLSVRGCPWLLSSDMLINHAKPFLKRSREYVNSLKEDYMYLCNFVDARNKHAIRWLEWLGFDILPTQAYGPHGIMFHPFEMKRQKL